MAGAWPAQGGARLRSRAGVRRGGRRRPGGLWGRAVTAPLPLSSFLSLNLSASLFSPISLDVQQCRLVGRPTIGGGHERRRTRRMRAAIDKEGEREIS